MFARLLHKIGEVFASPPVNTKFDVAPAEIGAEAEAPPSQAIEEIHPIAGFTCIIDYADANGECSQRLISCRTFEVRDGRQSVCAICHVRKAFRRFLVDRIEAVYEPESGTFLGPGTFFERFTPDVDGAGASPWGLTGKGKQTLVAGLNILAFMARCDGHWHPLEEAVFSDFVDQLWIAQGWHGEPPMCAIMDHARSLAPDRDSFFAAIRCYGRAGDIALLLRTVSDLIEADGVVRREEFDWSIELREALEEEAPRRTARASASSATA